MKHLFISLLLTVVTHASIASEQWQFSPRVAVTGEAQTSVFHHLEGAGRKHIAVSASTIAVIWEDNHSGDPQIYLSAKNIDGGPFSTAVQLSQGVEAYEPAISALSNGRFITAWEQDQSIYLRSIGDGQPGSALKLSQHPAGQVSLATFEDAIYAVWREQQGKRWSLWVARLALDADGAVSIQNHHRIEPTQYLHPVLFPVIAANEVGIMVAWEDRESGHTRLKYSFSSDQIRTFSAPQYLNEFYSNRNQYDKGSGVTRVSLAAYSSDEWIAAWMDKRRGGAGYGIFAAAGSDDAFGPNEKVHGEVGDRMPHYNPATAGNRAGKMAVAWNDFRHGTADIWISSYDDNDEWSADHAPAPAAGPAEQTHPAIALDEKNGLHLIWLERQSINAPTRIWYSYGALRQ